jgi:hypothetical protein
MQQLRGARLGLAAVVDRKNNFRGIVAIEDLSSPFSFLQATLRAKAQFSSAHFVSLGA